MSSSDDDCVPELVDASKPLMQDEDMSLQLQLRQKDYEEKLKMMNKESKNSNDNDTIVQPDRAVADVRLNENNNDDDDESLLVDRPPVPLVILSGFLGSGKTTLIQYILSANHGMKIAVIVNEFEFGRSIEKGLTVRSAEAEADEWMELRNGCMCCSAKSQSVQALEQLVLKRKGDLDAILIETAGLADPVPIARSFWLDDALQAKVQLAGIVVVVDSSNIEGYIKSEKHKFVEAARQLLSADRIVMNKIDVCGVKCGAKVVVDGDQDQEKKNQKYSSSSSSIFSFLDDQEKVNEFLFSGNNNNNCPESLQRAASTIKQVNPVAPITLTSLRSLLNISATTTSDEIYNLDESHRVPLEKLKKLLLLSNNSVINHETDGDDHNKNSNDNNTSNRWKLQESTHSHTTDMNSCQIEVKNRVFNSVRDVEFFYAHILDNSVDGQDEFDEELPAQLNAKDRGIVVVRSKSAVWVKNPEYNNKNDTSDNNNNNNDTTPSSSLKYLAHQVQSIGSTFEVVPMKGLNKKLSSQQQQQTNNNDNNNREDSAERNTTNENNEDESILFVGVNRLLLLGFGLKKDEIEKALNEKTIAIESK